MGGSCVASVRRPTDRVTGDCSGLGGPLSFGEPGLLASMDGGGITADVFHEMPELCQNNGNIKTLIAMTYSDYWGVIVVDILSEYVIMKKP